MNNINILSLICLNVTILFLWLKTNAFVEYCTLFKIKKLFYIEEYHKKNYEDLSLTYHDFLLKYHSCFINRLLTCPICTNIWLSIIFGSLYSFKLIPIIFISSLFLYKYLCITFENK